ncbi:MAG: bifunctional DNA-formamidopyrimidine glycosylase/DNA-(apurinic or apyrimidinic site) lyase, partial [Alphaproteobacteria bacterium]
MPELPEVETIRRALAARLEGRRLLAVHARRRDLRIPLPADFCRRLAGRRVSRVGRRAKYLLLTMDDGTVLLAHLGMSGRLVLGPDRASSARPAHEHIVFEFEGGDVLSYQDHRRFGLMALAAAGELERHPLLRRLGPEPLSQAFDGNVLRSLLRGKRTSIKAALLDQRVVAGLGNIYACEILHRAGVSPRRLAGAIGRKRVDRLARAVGDVLKEAIEAGGSSLRD